MKIKDTRFIVSNTDVKLCPKDSIPEYAFIGRSNVGKSSLINMLVGRKKMAKTSGTPGKTQLINHFKINNQWFLVDLPGYGYAKVSKKLRADFQDIIKNYFLKRRQLLCAFVLIDVRHQPQAIDLEFMEFLGVNRLPFCIVFTKADKLKSAALQENLAAYQATLLKEVWSEMPTYFVSSAVDQQGKEAILGFIAHTNDDFHKQFQ